MYTLSGTARETARFARSATPRLAALAPLLAAELQAIRRYEATGNEAWQDIAAELRAARTEQDQDQEL